MSVSNVVEFTVNDFSKKNPQKLSNTYKNKIVFVKYYSPRCIHCINSQPDYEKLATQYSSDSNYVIAQFNASANPDFMQTINTNNNLMFGYSVDGYPTFIIFVNTLYFQTYNGSRTVDQFNNTLANISDKLNMPILPTLPTPPTPPVMPTPVSTTRLPDAGTIPTL